MLRRSDADAIASALARRLRRPTSPIVASLSSRRAVAAIASRVARRLAVRRSPIVASLSSRRATAAIASRVAAALAIPISRRASRLSSLSRSGGYADAIGGLRSSRVRPVSPLAARLSGSSGRGVTRLASSIANRLATEGNVRQRARVSIDAVASEVTRRLRFTDQLGTFPITALTSSVARRLSSSRNRRTQDALASSIARRFAQRATTRGGNLPANREQDTRPGG
jgi:hypothetical protein